MSEDVQDINMKMGNGWIHVGNEEGVVVVTKQ